MHGCLSKTRHSHTRHLVLVVKCGMWVLYWYEGNRAWGGSFVMFGWSTVKQTVPNASIYVNGMNSNSYHFQMSPLKHFTYLPSLGWHQLLKMCGGSIIHGTVFRPHASLSNNPILKHAVGEVCIHKLFLAGPFSHSLSRCKSCHLWIWSVSVCTTLYHVM